MLMFFGFLSLSSDIMLLKLCFCFIVILEWVVDCGLVEISAKKVIKLLILSCGPECI